MSEDTPPDALADNPADVDVSPGKLLCEAFHDLEQFSVTLRTPEADDIVSVRDVLRVGKVCAVLPLDWNGRAKWPNRSAWPPISPPGRAN